MEAQKKVLADQLVHLALPKLKGLSEKNAKKLLALVEKKMADISKKYVKLVQEQTKNDAKAKAKELREKKRAEEKEAKKKLKLAKKVAEKKMVAQLMSKETVAAVAKPMPSKKQK